MDQDLSSIFCEVVKHSRKSLSISQEALADKSGLDRTYISGFERGARNITIHSLEKIISGLGMTSAIFLEKSINFYNENTKS